MHEWSMSIKFCVLASGSSANSIYLECADVRLLIDAGLSGKETTRRLAEIGVDIGEIDAVCVTHEHDDHRNALRILHQKHGAAVYANAGTIEALERSPKTQGIAWQVFTTGQAFSIGDLVLEPFSVPHDSYDPVGFVVTNGQARLGVVTDMGMTTELIRERLRGCQALIVEANHDVEMLRNSSRPWSLKQRILGRQGHLSNDQAGELVAEVGCELLQCVLLAHLSDDCNRPEVAVHVVRTALDNGGLGHVEVKLSYPDRISDIVTLEGR